MSELTKSNGSKAQEIKGKISSNDFVAIITAVATTQSIKVNGQNFNGSTTITLGDLGRYYSQVDKPDAQAQAAWVAVQGNIWKESPNYKGKAEDYVIENRASLAQTLNKRFADLVDMASNCITEGQKLELGKTTTGPDGMPMRSLPPCAFKKVARNQI